jgi:hypothetical protein
MFSFDGMAPLPPKQACGNPRRSAGRPGPQHVGAHESFSKVDGLRFCARSCCAGRPGRQHVRTHESFSKIADLRLRSKLLRDPSRPALRWQCQAMAALLIDFFGEQAEQLDLLNTPFLFESNY